MPQVPPEPPAPGRTDRLARSALIAAATGWVLVAAAAIVSATLSGPVTDKVATDSGSTAVGLIGLVGAIGLVAGVGRGVVALGRIRSGQESGRALALWAIGLGAVPFVVVLGLGLLTLLTHG